jgi:hypothetical protein
VHQKSVGTNGPTRQLELHPGQTVTANFVLEAPAK